MIVVFDTNIWKSNLYLRSPASAAVQLFLRIREARVGLPNVVKLEVERQLRRDIIKLRSQMRDNYQRMLAVFGSLKELVLPDDNMVDQIVSQIFRNTGFNYVEMPFRLEAAEDSFLRTIDKRRPSHGPQQFKDGVLWFDCKSFALEDDVLLVSDDKAFYENDKVANGLAHELMKEIVDLPYKIKMVPNLPTLLSGIRQTPAINEESSCRCY